MQTLTLDARTLETLVSAAVAAPSIHNTQPWRFRLDPDAVALEVRAAPERSLRFSDPAGRALHMSVGASLCNLRVAIAHFGWWPRTRLLPRPDDPRLLATVRLEDGTPAEAPQPPDLYEAIWRRHSSRFPFSGRPVSPAVLEELAETARVEGALLDFATPEEARRLLRITTEGERRNVHDPVRRDESRLWVQTPAREDRDIGMPKAALGPQDAWERIPMRDFTAAAHSERLPAAPFERSPLLAVLATPHDRRADWLRAGQALQHVLLVATSFGLRASLLHQAMEWPDLRREVSRPDAGLHHPQILLRLGYGPEGPSSPRRDPEAVMDKLPF
ncbi:Acg family FMN-binding oxidoreductase [Streptomyces sp. GC420]|uniref:Acg family FMN-binding oxidoreductase n=1 Tax=Streptomyces sp. GC420 TaxID=2697568 RepID=UPI001414FBF8|nr:nitroreductase family protein [Streptomyces sp. GC420]NBM18833.1 hypothetical protein [Streptomyces sp. GC420]